MLVVEMRTCVAIISVKPSASFKLTSKIKFKSFCYVGLYKEATS